MTETKELKKKKARNHEIPVSDILNLSSIPGLNNFNPDPVF